MIILTRDNVVSYIKDHVPSIKLEEPVQVNVIGEGEAQRRCGRRRIL